MSTGAGPNAGAFEGQLVQRFEFRGGETLEWMVERHAALAAIFGLAAIAVLLYIRRAGGDRRAQQPLLVVVGLLATQGVVGAVQWALELPAAIVWLHVALATTTWVAMLWTVATAGRLEPRRAEAIARRPAHPAGA
jgi:cytochrome c oxidase assembly protein subunit 15